MNECTYCENESEITVKRRRGRAATCLCSWLTDRINHQTTDHFSIRSGNDELKAVYSTMKEDLCNMRFYAEVLNHSCLYSHALSWPCVYFKSFWDLTSFPHVSLHFPCCLLLYRQHGIVLFLFPVIYFCHPFTFTLHKNR